PLVIGIQRLPCRSFCLSDRAPPALLTLALHDAPPVWIGVVGAVVDDRERAAATHQRIGTDRERSAGYGHERPSRIPLLPGNTSQRIIADTCILLTGCAQIHVHAAQGANTDGPHGIEIH